MTFYTESELTKMNFASLGANVKISREARLYYPETISIGDNSRIDDFVVMSGNIKIGRNVHVAVFCNLAGGTEGLTIGDFSGFAYNCQVFTQSDDYSGKWLTNPTVPDKFKREKKGAILIENHVLIGTSSIVFPGVVIREGCSVGALSMVTKSTMPWKVYFGIPAKIIKNRKRNLLSLEREYRLSELNDKKKSARI